ncbi:inclusion body family protein [uncultured Cedecea sp.]|uniref:inclusion body family protein n=1 Tax=uncultured Cedecea sp. TaxID=988762 RepID=UPI002604E094|nr:inclusion body family protein [uncultured Cedecea sp.]
MENNIEVSNISTRSSNKIINILVVIDTDSVINDFKGKYVSKDYTKPTSISHNYSYMVTTSAHSISGSGTADLNIKANVGDVIRWTGISESGNFDSSVLIYGVPKFKGDNVFVDPTFKSFSKRSMTPKQGGPFPVTFRDQINWFLQADIHQTGKEHYNIQFGVYYRPTGGEQELFGYFYWDPTITVRN